MSEVTYFALGDHPHSLVGRGWSLFLLLYQNKAKIKNPLLKRAFIFHLGSTMN